MSILRFSQGPASKPARRANLKHLFGIGALVSVIAIGSTLAANINLNDSTPVEFGQGVAQTVACDSQILVTPISTFQNDEESGFMFSGLGLSGVDTTDQANSSEGCAGRMFTIKAYDGSGNLLTPTYTVAVRSNGEFISEDGTASTAVGNDADDSTTVNFESPTISAEDVYRITIESSELSGCYGNHSGLDGLTPQTAAVSGYQLAQDCPGAVSGWYWIKSASMPNALQMYVDMTEDGGGYDFYFITAGPDVGYVTDTNGGTPLGLDLVMPRSKYHWRAMQNAVINASSVGSFYDYFRTSYGVYRNTNEYGWNFTANAMNSSDPTASQAWAVKDGGRWWLRDTPYSEPNGDYTLNGLLSGGMYDGWNLGDFNFNDGSTYFTGNYYLVSTNAKP
jgi:hypothetical protein